MLAEQRLSDGQLQAALEALQDDVRRAPANAKLRVFLFQLLTVLGQWERALKQLQVAATLDPEATAMAQTYRELIRCEVFRREVFEGKRAPLVVGEPEPWLASLVQALQHTAEGRHHAAEALRAESFATASASPGTRNGKPFEWLADADSRLGPVLEAVVRGRYHWVPYARLSKLEVTPPVDLRDLVWLPAKLTFQTGDETDCFIPTRYPGSEHSANDAVRLARRTEWLELGEQTACGLGQRVLTTDEGEAGLMDLRLVEFARAAESRTQASSTVESDQPSG
jgi:type VI secretion system protein ImpE